MDIENLRSRARVLLRTSAAEEYLDTDEALGILRDLAGVAPTPEGGDCGSVDCSGILQTGEVECALCGWEPDPYAMKLETFRAGAERIEWGEAIVDFEEAEQSYEDGPTPEALWVYPGSVWLVEMADERFELHLERSEYKSLDRDQLDRRLHEWAVRECNLHEPETRTDADVVDEIGGF